MAKYIVWTEQAKADVRGIEQPIALQILKTLARYAHTGEGNTKQLREIEPPLIRLRTQAHRPRPPPRTTAKDHRVFFRDKGDCLEISRVLDRKEAYR
jgi:plasmid stabilization system protein ParE